MLPSHFLLRGAELPMWGQEVRTSKEVLAAIGVPVDGP